VKPTTIDEYLDRLTAGQRKLLEKLRLTIRSAAPRAEECISYGIPAFCQDGVLVGFSASQHHCSFFPMSGHTVAEFQKELEGFTTSKGTIHFSADKPLPAAIVRKIVKARVAENVERAKNQPKSGKSRRK
jgi:uncharacterized protein YdhG (YjbR/CyaY superfamily)